MNGINDDAIMAALGRRMTLAVASQAVAASNLATLDTPGYKAKEATFDDALTHELQKNGLAPPKGTGVDLTSTNAAHIGGSIITRPRVNDVENAPTRRDGNNVEMDRELLQMNRNASDFAAAQTVLAAKFRLIRYAIDEGR
jgi:flagellar basal-body rod protein FlgB